MKQIRILISSVLAATLLFTSVISASGAYSSYILRGDADGSGKPEASDARKILRVAAELDAAPAASGSDFKRYDTDNDGKITVIDAREALRLAVGLDTLASVYSADEITAAYCSAVNAVTDNANYFTRFNRETTSTVIKDVNIPEELSWFMTEDDLKTMMKDADIDEYSYLYQNQLATSDRFVSDTSVKAADVASFTFTCGQSADVLSTYADTFTKNDTLNGSARTLVYDLKPYKNTKIANCVEIDLKLKDCVYTSIPTTQTPAERFIGINTGALNADLLKEMASSAAGMEGFSMSPTIKNLQYSDMEGKLYIDAATGKPAAMRFTYTVKMEISIAATFNVSGSSYTMSFDTVSSDVSEQVFMFVGTGLYPTKTTQP